MNINDAASLNGNKSNNKYQTPEPQPSSESVQSPPLNTSLNSSFKRGGLRSTADARLIGNYSSVSNIKSASKSSLKNRESNGRGDTLSSASGIPAFILDTLSFAKWNTHQVCEWLNKNGFEAYFQPGSDGQFTHKWIKNGLHLLQASQYEYEKELGIKNALHRKKLYILLQSLYNNINGNGMNALENNYLYLLDQNWVMSKFFCGYFIDKS